MMKAGKLIALAMVVAAVLAVPAAAQSTRNQRYKGYTFTNNVEDLMRLSVDYCQMLGAIANSQPEVARNIFYNGSAALPLTYNALVTSTANQGQPMYSTIFSGVTFRAPSDIVAKFEAAVAAGNPFLYIQTMLYGANGKIMFDFLDSALRSVRTNKVVQANIDSAWAMFAGRPNMGPCPNNMFDIFNEFTDVFGNAYRGVPTSDLYMAWQFGNAQAMSKSPTNLTASRQAITDASRAIASVYGEFGLQFLLYNGVSADIGKACNNPGLVQFAGFQNNATIDMVLALVKGMGASDTSIAALQAVLNPGGAGFNATVTALQPILSQIGIPLKNLVVSGPNITAVKMKWYQNQGVDVRNCTAI